MVVGEDDKLPSVPGAKGLWGDVLGDQGARHERGPQSLQVGGALLMSLLYMPCMVVRAH